MNIALVVPIQPYSKGGSYRYPVSFLEIPHPGGPGGEYWHLPSVEAEGASPSSPHLVQLEVFCDVCVTQQTLSCRMLTPKQETLGSEGIIPTWQPVPTKPLAVGPQSPLASHQPKPGPPTPINSGSHLCHHLHHYTQMCFP